MLIVRAWVTIGYHKSAFIAGPRNEVDEQPDFHKSSVFLCRPPPKLMETRIRYSSRPGLGFHIAMRLLTAAYGRNGGDNRMVRIPLKSLLGEDFRCAQWKLPAKERYDGDFDVGTRNPVLIINNRFDPVTPLASARNQSSAQRGCAP